MVRGRPSQFCLCTCSFKGICWKLAMSMTPWWVIVRSHGIIGTHLQDNHKTVSRPDMTENC